MIERLINIVFWRYGDQLILLCTEILVKFAKARPCPVLIRAKACFLTEVIIVFSSFLHGWMIRGFLNPYKLVCTQLRQPRRVELSRKPYLAGSPVLTQFRTRNIRLRSSILLWGPLSVIAIILNFLFMNSRSLCSTRRARLHVFKFIDCKSIYLLGLSICSHHNKQIEGLEQSNFKPVDLSANMRKFAFF